MTFSVRTLEARRDLDTPDIPRIAELDSDAWRDLHGPGNLALVADQIERVGLGVVSDLGYGLG